MLLPNLVFPTCLRSFWILMCCLLLSHEFQVHARYDNPASKHNLGNVTSMDKRTGGSALCSDWQVYNGFRCTCPKPAEEACRGAQGGIVCDNFQKRYPSLCYFSAKVCRGELSLLHDISTCGLCSNIRLMNSSILHLNAQYGLSTFTLLDNTQGKKAQFISDYNSNLKIYFEEQLNKWIIGEKRGRKDMLLAQFMGPTPFIQDSQTGAYVVRQNLTNGIEVEAVNASKFHEIFIFDPHLHLQCIEIDRSYKIEALAAIYEKMWGCSSQFCWG